MTHGIQVNSTTVNDGDEVAVTIKGTVSVRPGQKKLWMRVPEGSMLILSEGDISSFSVLKRAEPVYEVGQVYMSSYRSSLFRYQGGAASWRELSSDMVWGLHDVPRPLRRVTIHED